MTQNEFKNDILILQKLWNRYISIPKHFNQSGEALQQYHAKLNEISARYHMKLEDISMFVR